MNKLNCSLLVITTSASLRQCNQRELIVLGNHFRRWKQLVQILSHQYGTLLRCDLQLSLVVALKVHQIAESDAISRACCFRVHERRTDAAILEVESVVLRTKQLPVDAILVH